MELITINDAITTTNQTVQQLPYLVALQKIQSSSSNSIYIDLDLSCIKNIINHLRGYDLDPLYLDVFNSLNDPLTPIKELELIELNIGGQIFKTTKSTLTKIPYFDVAITRWKVTTFEFIDRSPTHFEYILSFARNPRYVIPLDIVHQIRADLDFYNLDPFRKIEQKSIPKLEFLESESKPQTRTDAEVYLTSNPGITFFRKIYRRHTDFNQDLKILHPKISSTPENLVLIFDLHQTDADLLEGFYLVVENVDIDLQSMQSILSSIEFTVNIDDDKPFEQSAFITDSFSGDSNYMIKCMKANIIPNESIIELNVLRKDIFFPVHTATNKRCAIKIKFKSRIDLVSEPYIVSNGIYLNPDEKRRESLSCREIVIEQKFEIEGQISNKTCTLDLNVYGPVFKILIGIYDEFYNLFDTSNNVDPLILANLELDDGYSVQLNPILHKIHCSTFNIDYPTESIYFMPFNLPNHSGFQPSGHLSIKTAKLRIETSVDAAKVKVLIFKYNPMHIYPSNLENPIFMRYANHQTTKKAESIYDYNLNPMRTETPVDLDLQNNPEPIQIM